MSLIDKIKSWFLSGKVSLWKASTADLDRAGGIKEPKPWEYMTAKEQEDFVGLKATFPLPGDRGRLFDANHTKKEGK